MTPLQGYNLVTPEGLEIVFNYNPSIITPLRGLICPQKVRRLLGAYQVLGMVFLTILAL